MKSLELQGHIYRVYAIVLEYQAFELQNPSRHLSLFFTLVWMPPQKGLRECWSSHRIGAKILYKASKEKDEPGH